MTTIERVGSADRSGRRNRCHHRRHRRAHPLPVSADVLKSYAPAEWVDKILADRQRNRSAPVPHSADTPDLRTRRCRCAWTPPRLTAGLPAATPTSAPAGQLLAIDAGVSITRVAGADVRRTAPAGRARSGSRPTTIGSPTSGWTSCNGHGRWRGSISVSATDPAGGGTRSRGAGRATPYHGAGADDTAVTRGIHSRQSTFRPPVRGCVAQWASSVHAPDGADPFELIPLYPVGNPAHWHDFFASWPLLYVSHLMSLVFDGAFDRHPGPTGGLRRRRLYLGDAGDVPDGSGSGKARRGDLPHVRRRPSDYVREHVQVHHPANLEGADTAGFREYLEMMDSAYDNLMFSTDYPHWSYDSPTYAINRFPADQRERIMHGNATALYGLPPTVKALPGERPAPLPPRADLGSPVSTASG